MNKKDNLLQIERKESVLRERTSGTKVPPSSSSPNAWIECWFRMNEVTFCYDGNHTIYDESYPDGRKVINSETLYNYIMAGSGLSGVKDIRPLIKPFISNWEVRERARVKRELIKSIKFNSEVVKDRWIEKFVIALTGRNDEVEIAIIENFILSVKRKMNDKSVSVNLFPILQGKQNSGKSTAVSRLLSPIDKFWTDRSLDILNQEKNLKVLGLKYVIWFDEMARAKRADVDAVKKHTTGKYVNFRRFHTQDEVSMKNISTFIGCTNRSVADIFYDPTGSRRFYEFKCLDKVDWDVINEIDYLKLWQSVDENKKESSLSSYLDELESRQANIKSMDSVEEFMTFENLLPLEGFETMEVTFSDLYKAYSRWVLSQRMNGHFKMKKFALRLNELGVNGLRRSDARYRVIKKCDFYSLLPTN